MYIDPSDFQTIREDCNNPTFVFNNEEYECIAAPGGESAIVTIGGIERIADLVIQALVSAFEDSTMPSYGKLIIHKSKTYRVERVSQEESGTLVKFLCVSPTRMGNR